MFNYIVNIHNSENHLEIVLDALFNVKGKDSRVYAVLDGCTDRSSEITKKYDLIEIVTPDVRETKAITIALSQVSKEAKYNFIMQDDVVLKEPRTEEYIQRCYEMFPNIGVLGMRHGSNFLEDTLSNGRGTSETDLIQNEHQPPLPDVALLPEGYITQRQVVYKSPICISTEVVNTLRGYDRRFEPIAHDDTEYCIRAYRNKLINMVLSISLLQPPSWGGTRRFPEVHKDSEDMHKKHMDLLRKLYPVEIAALSIIHPSLNNIKIW